MDGIRETVERNHETLTGLQRHVTAIHEATDTTGTDRRAKAEVWSVLPDAETDDCAGMTPAEIADGLGGPFTATTVASLLETMADDGHVTTPDGTHDRRAD